jgi:cardiolipin synthase (CMP-forming)
MAATSESGWFRFVRHPGEMRLSWATRITLLRILLVVPFVSCMLNINDTSLSETTRTLLRYGAVAVYVVMAVSDGLDGYLARRRKEVTKLGTFLDPLADKLLITSACLLLVSQRGHVEGFLLPVTVVAMIIGKDVLIVIGFFLTYLITSHIHIVPVFLGKLATALQLIMVALVLVAPEVSTVVPGYHGFLQVFWWSAGIAAILALLVYIRNGTRYIEAFERSLAKNADARDD